MTRAAGASSATGAVDVPSAIPAVDSFSATQAADSLLFAPEALAWAATVVGGIVLLASSGRFVEWSLSHVEEPVGGAGGEVSQTERDVGRVIGKFENVLVYVFVLSGAYTALALVFAAKSIVRRRDMRNNSRYYLAGTLANFTYSLLVGVAVRAAVRLL